MASGVAEPQRTGPCAISWKTKHGAHKLAESVVERFFGHSGPRPRKGRQRSKICCPWPVTGCNVLKCWMVLDVQKFGFKQAFEQAFGSVVCLRLQ